MLVGALAARVFAYCNGGRTAALRTWLMSLRASLAHIQEKWSQTKL
jgi:hypothetical protein